MTAGVVPVPPDRVRPGQLGVVLLGRVIIGDIATTLVDLSVRGMLTVGEHDEEGQAGWLLGAARTGHQPDNLLSYERTLLAAVSDGGKPATLQSLAPRMPKVLAGVRDEIIHDAVGNGWLHRLHHGQRTCAGDQLPGSGASSGICAVSALIRAGMPSPAACCRMRCTSECWSTIRQCWSGSRTPGWRHSLAFPAGTS